MKDSFVRAAKEFFRVVVVAVIPMLVVGLQEGRVDLKVVALVAAIAGLRFLDKFLHELGKEVGSSRLVGGLTRF